jgi:hypothetical protein
VKDEQARRKEVGFKEKAFATCRESRVSSAVESD